MECHKKKDVPCNRPHARNLLKEGGYKMAASKMREDQVMKVDFIWGMEHAHRGKYGEKRVVLTFSNDGASSLKTGLGSTSLWNVVHS